MAVSLFGQVSISSRTAVPGLQLDMTLRDHADPPSTPCRLNPGDLHRTALRTAPYPLSLKCPRDAPVQDGASNISAVGMMAGTGSPIFG